MIRRWGWPKESEQRPARGRGRETPRSSRALCPSRAATLAEWLRRQISPSCAEIAAPRDRSTNRRNSPSRPSFVRAREESVSTDRSSGGTTPESDKLRRRRRTSNWVTETRARGGGSFSWRWRLAQKIEYTVHIPRRESGATLNVGVRQG